MAGPEVNMQVNVQVGARPRLREPGLAGFAPGTERYRVAGGASLAVALQPGDHFLVGIARRRVDFGPTIRGQTG